MNKKLRQKTEEWMQLERRTLEQRRAAEEYYEQNLMKLIEDDYVKRNKEKVQESVEYLVISVGTSYEPIVLNIKLLHPKKILFLYTERSARTLDKIVAHCELKIADYERRIVNETSPLDIYREIKRAYLLWQHPEKMYIDFTGGTKAMSAAAAMAGAVISVQLVYVGTNDYLVDFRKPNPGSETLQFIDNPLSVFGDMEIEKAFSLFEKHNYAGAQERLEVLKEEIPDPALRQQLNFTYLLAKAYEAWDALDMEPAYLYMQQLNRELDRDGRINRHYMLMDLKDDFRVQEEALKHLQKIPELMEQRKKQAILMERDTIHSLMFTMRQNARAREDQEKYDMATLLMYRLLEMVEQRRLAQFNLYVSAMDYDHIRYRKERNQDFLAVREGERKNLLQRKVYEIKERVFGSCKTPYLQDHVALLDGYILLLALNDELMNRPGIGGINGLKKIRSMVYLRNNSIFAHGLGPVGADAYGRFRDFVEQVFAEFCEVERIDTGFYDTAMAWKTPRSSRYCLAGSGEK